MHRASAAEQDQVVEILLVAKADVDSRDKDRRNALLAAFKNGHINVVDQLLLATTDVLSPDEEGTTTLHLAVQWSEGIAECHASES